MKTDSFLKHFVSLGVGSFVYLLIGLIGTPIITRLVDPSSYGDYSVFTVYSSLGLAVFVMGLDQSYVRFFYAHESKWYRSRLLYACMIPAIVAVLVVGLLILAIGLKSGWLGEYITFGELILVVLNVIVLIVNRYSTLSARLDFKTNLYSFINITQKFLFLLLSSVLVLGIRSHLHMLLIFSSIISTVIASAIGIVKEKELWLYGQCEHSEYSIPWREMIRFGFPLLFSVGVTSVLNALDKLALDRFCTRADVGVYTSALNLLAVFSVIRISFNALWMPSAVEHYEKDKENTEFYRRGHSFIAMLMLIFGAGMIMCKDMFVLLLGEEYRSAALIFPFLMFEPIMYTISETTVTGLVVTKKSGYQVIAAVVACVTNFIGNWILTPRMGPQGAAISTGISYIIFFVMRTVLANIVYYVNYQLPKMAVMTILLAVYAVYGSMNSFSVYQIVFFMVYSGILLMVYRKESCEALAYAQNIIRKVVHKA